MTSPAESQSRPLLPFFLSLLALVLSYLPVIEEIVRAWVTDPDYSHGFFVIPVAAVLCWKRWPKLPPLAPGAWPGIVVVSIGLSLRVVAIIFGVLPIEEYSFLVALAGIVWYFCGYGIFRWSAPTLAFLVFMIPLPYTVAISRAAQLQRLSAAGSAYLLQTLGIPALAEGNIIRLDNESVDVAYACSGLQMMIAFLAVTAAVALLSHYSWIGKLVLMCSGIPIAIACNMLRITATAVGYQMYPGSSAAVRAFIHDFGGFALIPIAIGLVFLELFVFERSFPKVVHRI